MLHSFAAMTIGANAAKNSPATAAIAILDLLCFCLQLSILAVLTADPRIGKALRTLDRKFPLRLINSFLLLKCTWAVVAPRPGWTVMFGLLSGTISADL